MVSNLKPCTELVCSAGISGLVEGWLPGVPGLLISLLGFVVVFGPFLTVLLSIASVLFALYQAWQLGSRESLFLAIPALLIALLTFKWLFDNWPAN